MNLSWKTNFQLEEEIIGVIFFCGTFDPAALQDCTKFPRLITNVLLQLVKEIINEVCYQRYEKRLEQQKGRPKQWRIYA